ncbi:MAG: lysophospholipid acyltransferase family protein [Propionibacteriaceae bacterium]|nr:lysophospholipid acyltransferase family protein [Propionibacteriaceae bacterium]
MKHTPKPWRRSLRVANRESAPWPYRLLACVAHGILGGLIRRSWQGQEHLPAGGVLVVSNHLSNFDVLALGEYLIWSGRWPRFLGKSEIWRVPVVGWFARTCRQIPVLRNTDRAKDSLVHAREALEAGDCVAIFPEGTITADPDGWPMVGRLGAARLALTTGVPVVPVAQIGSDALLGRKRLELRRLFSLRRRPVSVLAGPPVDLGTFAVDPEPSREDLVAATQHIMSSLTALVADLRGETAPEGRWDMRIGARVSPGSGEVDR